MSPRDYARTRNHLDGAVTGLSAYLTHGLVSTREVLAGVLARESLEVGHKLVYELGWREYFRHAWAHEGDRILASLHAGPRPDDHYRTDLPEDIRQARTGVPVIDQAVRHLYATGYLHNHARMWLASYVVHLRQVHWRTGADWMVAHLLDGDLASNHLSWQWVAGTGSHKPYLFNAENVARFAPASWHSPGTVIDQSYEALNDIAHGLGSSCMSPSSTSTLCALPDGVAQAPALWSTPPEDLGLASAPQARLDDTRAATIWLVHPWALRPPPASLGPKVRVIGVYLREYHAAWPWSEARWRWVDAAMACLTQERWFLPAAELARLRDRGACVRSTDDPHVRRWLGDAVVLEPAPGLFPPVDRHCTSFSQWWTRATRGLRRADELLGQPAVQAPQGGQIT